MKTKALTEAKRVLAENAVVPYGIFGVISAARYFPPRSILNEFFALGYDACDQDGRMRGWTPFELTEEEYREVRVWWLTHYPQATEDSLGVSSWNDWVSEIIELET